MVAKPNIIWIYCDELRTDALECYGNRYTPMQTPNIDWLASRGILFENTFCNSPVCVASRTSTLTAHPPEDTGVYNNEAARPHYKLDHRFETFPEVFARHGYMTANFGKVHVPEGIDAWMHNEPAGGYMKTFYEDVSRENLDIISVPTFPYIVIGGRYPADRDYPADPVTRNALRWLETRESPFFIRLSYLQPHTPVLPPPPYDQLYSKVDFPRELSSSDHLSKYDQRYREIVQSDQLTSEQIHRIHVEYYGLVAWLDNQIGMLIDYLKRQSLLENTIIVFEADHGNSLGEGGRLQKLTFAPEVLRVPRIISWQGTLPHGHRRSDICQSMDIGKTLLDLAEIPIPEAFHGRRLFSDDAHSEVYATIGYGYESSRTFPSSARGTLDDEHGWPRRTCVRTDRFRLDKNVLINGKLPSTNQEDIFLADTLVDPLEMHNCAHDPRYKAVIGTLSASIDTHTTTHYTPPESYTRGLEDLQ